MTDSRLLFLIAERHTHNAPIMIIIVGKVTKIPQFTITKAEITTWSPPRPTTISVQTYNDLRGDRIAKSVFLLVSATKNRVLPPCACISAMITHRICSSISGTPDYRHAICNYLRVICNYRRAICNYSHTKRREYPRFRHIFPFFPTYLYILSYLGRILAQKETISGFSFAVKRVCSNFAAILHHINQPLPIRF